MLESHQVARTGTEAESPRLTSHGAQVASKIFEEMGVGKDVPPQGAGASRLGDGGPAFPGSPTLIDPAEGMSLRDYFAAKALQGLLANPNVIGHSSRCGWAPVNCSMRNIAEFCVASADDVLQARSAPPSSEGSHNG